MLQGTLARQRATDDLILRAWGPPSLSVSLSLFCCSGESWLACCVTNRHKVSGFKLYTFIVQCASVRSLGHKSTSLSWVTCSGSRRAATTMCVGCIPTRRLTVEESTSERPRGVGRIPFLVVGGPVARPCVGCQLEATLCSQRPSTASRGHRHLLQCSSAAPCRVTLPHVPSSRQGQPPEGLPERSLTQVMSPHLQHLPWGRVEGLTGREPRGAGAKGPALSLSTHHTEWPRKYNSEAHLGHIQVTRLCFDLQYHISKLLVSLDFYS